MGKMNVIAGLGLAAILAGCATYGYPPVPPGRFGPRPPPVMPKPEHFEKMRQDRIKMEAAEKEYQNNTKSISSQRSKGVEYTSSNPFDANEDRMYFNLVMDGLYDNGIIIRAKDNVERRNIQSALHSIYDDEHKLSRLGAYQNTDGSLSVWETAALHVPTKEVMSDIMTMVAGENNIITIEKADSYAKKVSDARTSKFLEEYKKEQASKTLESGETNQDLESKLSPEQNKILSAEERTRPAVYGLMAVVGIALAAVFIYCQKSGRKKK